MEGEQGKLKGRGRAIVWAFSLVALVALIEFICLNAKHIKLVDRGPPPSPESCAEQLAAIVNRTDVTNVPLELRLRHYTQTMLQRNLDAYLDRNGVTWLEGHAGSFPEQQVLYLQLAAIGCVATVCEVGFRAGHSATVWLSSKPDLRVHAFDPGEHAYTRTALEFFYREEKWRRLSLTLGDSLRTVPRAASDPGHPSCDLVSLDGGHTFAAAMGDIIHMRQMASKDFAVFVMNNVYCEGAAGGGDQDEEQQQQRRQLQQQQELQDHCQGPTAALEAAVRHGLVEVVKVFRSSDGTRGFAVGRYT